MATVVLGANMARSLGHAKKNVTLTIVWLGETTVNHAELPPRARVGSRRRRRNRKQHFDRVLWRRP
jgi:hypothetical protein